MTLHPQALPPIPELTAPVAQAAFPNSNLYLQLRDHLGILFTDDDFAALSLGVARWPSHPGG